MLIGRIQGNEPGGFLSADLYADMSLDTGNLIIVPRANFYSIIMNSPCSKLQGITSARDTRR